MPGRAWDTIVFCLEAELQAAREHRRCNERWIVHLEEAVTAMECLWTCDRINTA
jgi:hypothetical protein